MKSGLPIVDPNEEEPVTSGERQRVGDLLSSVSTRTLLQSLGPLCGMNDDAKLIIAELVDRLSPDPTPGDDL